ncbi:MAG: hypothetical protein ACRD6U_10855 [Nitrososphaeraceae archaeon]
MEFHQQSKKFEIEFDIPDLPKDKSKAKLIDEQLIEELYHTY